ncbi:MAG TPA: YhfC family glutamic-type intramembrane protease [Candidatus Humimicrobiaceae bacterium]
MEDMLVNISYIISIVIEIGIPVILAFYMWKKYRISWAIFFLGMLLFLVSLSRIPLNNVFSSYVTLKFSGDMALILAGLFVSLTAGIFEEGVRVLAFGLIIKSRSYEKAVMYGIGHGGGGESMIFVGISVLVSFIIYRLFPGILPAGLLPQIAGAEWYLPLIGALERILAIAIQISLSVLVMHAFLKRKYYFILIAILYHMTVDFISIYINYKFGIFLTEIMIFIFAGISIALIYFLRPGKREFEKKEV